MSLAEELTRVTGMSAKERQDCLRWFARQAESFQITLMSHRFRIFHSMKNKYAHIKPPLLEFAALLVAAKGNGWLASKKMKTQRVPSQKEMQMIAARRSERARRERHPADKRAKLARIWGVVVELRGQGHSYAAIVDYLRIAHKIQITRQYLHQIYRKWENEGC